MQTKNIKKYISAVILSAILLLSGLETKAQNSRLTMHKPARNLVTQERIERETAFLADSICQGRATGTRGSVEAAFWIADKFKAAGLLKLGEGWGQSLTTENGTIGHNIIGLLPGSAKVHPDRYIIVGAHYDHLGMLDGKMYPGADSNASGVTAMTSLAEMFGAMRKMGKIYSSNIIFVAFDAKEFDLKGSDALWDMIRYGRLRNPLTGETITKEKISLMVNIDQIGSSLAPVNKDRKDYIIMLGTSSLKKDKRELLHRCNLEEGIGMDISLDYYGSANFTKIFYTLSDQKVFVENRMPAVLFTSGITMNNNKTWDRTENMDIDVYLKRIRLMYHWIEKML